MAFQMGTATRRETKVHKEGLLVRGSEEHTRNVQGLEKQLSILI